ncbi:MAG TPA: phosphotransferase [Terracidiphilus sp.]
MTAETKAHGLDGLLTEPDWPPLTPDEIELVLARYPELSPPFEIVSISPRPFSAASVIRALERCVFVKRHAKAVRDVEGLCEEHRFMAHLRSRGAAVADVLADRDGSTAIEIGEWIYEVHAVPPGVDAYEDAVSWTPFRSAAHARSAGELLAKLHLAAQGYDAPARIGRQLVAGFTIFSGAGPNQRLGSYVHARPALDRYLQQSGCAQEAMSLLAPFFAELEPLLSNLAPLWTHNDLHPSNLFWTSGGPEARATAAIDFGLCDRTNAVHDLAHAIERSIVEWLLLVSDAGDPQRVPAHMDHLWALLEGYEAVRPMSRAEASALPPMLALCHAEFALSEADYFLSVLHSREKAYMACEGYLLRHARWWHGAGKSMLNSLRDWAHARRPGVCA